MIQTHDLTRRFGNATAVDGLNLSVERGEVFAFLGPNGAGKTTTVRMLTCLIAPTSGEAMVAGRRVGPDNDDIRAHIGILTEAPGLYERLNAAQNLAFFAQLYGLPAERSDAQVRRYLTLLGLWERRHEAVGTFSKGMKQKLAIARALLHEPELLFLDEPTSALDPESAKVVRDFIAELKGEGRTIFLCTHNLDEADRLCDRIGVFKTHLLVVDTGHCKLFELFDASYNGTWNAGAGAIFDLNSNALRPAGWTSADAAGLPILPGLARYDEVATGVIPHALRFTVRATNGQYIWPGRHLTSSPYNAAAPPIGQRFRLKASFDVSTFTPQVRVILTALKTYGMFVADNGSDWYISGAPDSNWINDDLVRELRQVTGTNFEAVDESFLMVNPDSGLAQWTPGNWKVWLPFVKK